MQDTLFEFKTSKSSNLEMIYTLLLTILKNPPNALVQFRI